MNRSFQSAADELSVKLDCKQCLAINQYGDIVIVGEKGRLLLGNVRSEGFQMNSKTEVFKSSPQLNGKIFQELNIENESSDITEITDIGFDSDGATLVVWGMAFVGMIEIAQLNFNRENYMNSKNDNSDAKISCNYSRIFDVESCNEKRRCIIAKVSFLSTSSQHLAILLDRDALYLLDLRTLQNERISLPYAESFVSFCSGPFIDWMEFSIFLLSTKGKIFVLCPILPVGIAVSRSKVNELWNWTDRHSQRLASMNERDNVQNKTLRVYLQKLKQYLHTYLCPSSPDHSILTNSSVIIAGERSDVLEYDRDVEEFMLHNYSPLPQGPLMIERGPYPATNDRIANDICTPSMNVNQSRGHKGSPVLTISYSNGDVEYLLVDLFTQDWFQDFSPYLGPCWRSFDQTIPDITYPSPHLLLAERIAMPGHPHQGFWKLSTDPVVSHYLHVTEIMHARTYILSSSWLRNALEGVSSHSVHEETLQYKSSKLQKPRIKSGYAFDVDDYEEDEPSPDMNFNMELSTSLCIPVYAPTTNNGGTNFNDSIQVETKGNESSYDIYASGSRLNGMIVIYDPFVGHILLLRTSSGDFSVVNITVHMKLFEMQNELTSSSIYQRTSETSILPGDSSEGVSTFLPLEINVRYTKKLIAKIVTGLQMMPQIFDKMSSDTEKTSEVEVHKYLSLASRSLEANVLHPLADLAQFNKIQLDLLKDRSQEQWLLLEGQSSGEQSLSMEMKSDRVVPDGSGLQHTIDGLHSDQKQLTDRILSITLRFEEIKKKTEGILSKAFTRRKKLNEAEIQYMKQLEKWSQVISSLHGNVEKLKRLSRPSVQSSIASPFSMSNTSASGQKLNYSDISHHILSSPYPVSSMLNSSFNQMSSTPPPFRTPTFGKLSLNPTTQSTPQPPTHSLMETNTFNLLTPPSMNILETSKLQRNRFELRQSNQQSAIRRRFASHATKTSTPIPSSPGLVGNTSFHPDSQPTIKLSDEETAQCFELLKVQQNRIEHNDATILALQQKIEQLKMREGGRAVVHSDE